MQPKAKRNLIRSWQPADLTQLELQRGFSVNRPVPRHWHEEYQFCLIDAGRGDLTYRGKDFLTPPASLFIVHPGEVHSNRAFDANGCSFRTIFLETAVLQSVVAELRPQKPTLPFFPSTMIFEPDTLDQFVNLHQLFEQPSSRLEREIVLRNFLVQLIARHAESRALPTSCRTAKKAVKRACDYLTANYAENISLDQLAAIAELSPFHFSRVFSAEFGLPPHEFQVQLRLAQAKRLLREGLEIAPCALQTGFADQSHLTRHFKRVFGITPGQFV